MTKSKQKPSSPITVRDHQLYYGDTPVSSMAAYPVTLAAKILGIGRSTLWREVRLGKIKQTRLKLIPKDEVDRYLREDAVAVAA